MEMENKRISYKRNFDIVSQGKLELRYSNNEDFETWQSKAREKLYQLLGLEQMIPCEDRFQTEYEKENKNYNEIRFTFESEPGYRVPCHMLIPKDAPAPYKPVICLQGHSTGMHISLGRPIYDGDDETIQGGDRDFAVRAVKEGYLAIVLEQRYMGECGGDQNGPGCCKGDALPALLNGRCAIGERVWDIITLINVLEKYFKNLDMEKLICLGNSGGGTTTFYAACMDERIRLAVPSCSICTYKDSIVALKHCACNYIPGISRYFDMGDLAGLIAPRKLIIVNGKEDNIFPMNGVLECYHIAQKLYDTISEGENIKLVTGESGHRFYADAAWTVIHGMMD